MIKEHLELVFAALVDLGVIFCVVVTVVPGEEVILGDVFCVVSAGTICVVNIGSSVTLIGLCVEVIAPCSHTLKVLLNL